jgi:uncharacterized protein YbaP (TraB family)
MRSTLKLIGVTLALPAGLGLWAAPSWSQSGRAVEEQIEEIVVTASRSGAPLWRVDGPRSTLILVGSISGVSKATRWNPAALTDALRKADRVMFPERQAFRASPFSAIGLYAKWRSMGSLPGKQTLSAYLPADQMRRLSALQQRGLTPKQFEKRHPMHLAGDIRDRVRGKGYGISAGGYVERAIKQYKLRQVPVPVQKAKQPAKALFASSPRDHVPCLLAAMALAEAGPGAIQARSDAWAQRRVQAVLASPAEKAWTSCWPETLAQGREGALRQTVRRLLNEPQVTVAVLNLATLARRGGVLDDLEAAGYEISGPDWKD